MMRKEKQCEEKSWHQGIFDFDISTANSNNKTPHQNPVKIFTQSTPHSTAKSAQSTNCGTELDFSALLSSASEQKANYDVTSRSQRVIQVKKVTCIMLFYTIQIVSKHPKAEK